MTDISLDNFFDNFNRILCILFKNQQNTKKILNIKSIKIFIENRFKTFKNKKNKGLYFDYKLPTSLMWFFFKAKCHQ